MKSIPFTVWNCMQTKSFKNRSFYEQCNFISSCKITLQFLRLKIKRFFFCTKQVFEFQNIQTAFVSFFIMRTKDFVANEQKWFISNLFLFLFQSLKFEVYFVTMTIRKVTNAKMTFCQILKIGGLMKCHLKNQSGVKRWKLKIIFLKNFWLFLTIKFWFWVIRVRNFRMRIPSNFISAEKLLTMFWLDRENWDYQVRDWLIQMKLAWELTELW